MRGLRGEEQIEMNISAQKPKLLPGQEVRPPKNRNVPLYGITD